MICVFVCFGVVGTGDYETVLAKYGSLADFFQAHGDVDTALFFLDKALRSARLAGDTKSELWCLQQLGLAYEAAGRLVQALDYHEAHLSLASSHEMAGEEARANNQLVRRLLHVYRCLGCKWGVLVDLVKGRRPGWCRFVCMSGTVLNLTRKGVTERRLIFT